MKYQIWLIIVFCALLFTNCADQANIEKGPVAIPRDSTNLLLNGSFNYDKSIWQLSSRNESVVEWSVEDSIALIIINNGGSNRYDIEFSQNEVKVEKDKTYKISFLAKSAGRISFTASLLNPEEPFTVYTSTNIEVTPEFQEYSFEFTQLNATDLNASFRINLGGNSGKILYLDDILIEETKEQNVSILEIDGYSTGDRNQFITQDKEYTEFNNAFDISESGSWVKFRLKYYSTFDELQLIFENPNNNNYIFEVHGSTDGINFKKRGAFITNGLTTSFESYDLNYYYGQAIKIVNPGNSEDNKLLLEGVELVGRLTNKITEPIEPTPALEDGLDTDWDEITFVKHYHTPYDLPVSDRYTYDNGLEYFHVYSDDLGFEPGTSTLPRSEVRIWDRNYTTGSYQLSFDMMVPAGTTGCSLVQIFGGGDNGGATSLMLHVYDGILYKYTSHVLISDIYDEWHSYIIQHYANTGDIRIYIDGDLAVATKDRGDDNHYFKYGVYEQWNQPSDKMESYFRNVKLSSKE